MLNSDRLLAAWHRLRDDLLAERTPDGHWIGELATSALSTATAVSALCLARGTKCGDRGSGLGARDSITPNPESRIPSPESLSSLIAGGLAYLVSHQNADGGWGDTDKSYSNIATTMLAIAAIHLAGGASEHAALLARANAYVDAEGRLQGLRARYGKDKTFVVPILTNCALAGLVPWKDVAPLPFELACVPQAWYRFVKMPVVSYAVPALVAIGQAKFHHDPPWNPLARMLRAASIERSLKVLLQMQPASGGYLEAVPLTSFVVMSLASIGRADHPVTQAGVSFLINSVRPDGSWPIDTNLATWVTSLAVNALAGTGGSELGAREEMHGSPVPSPLPWLLRCQHTKRHPFTGADPGARCG
jgi:squalene-hopene/tetraprenyl-beta-curcumene cyclase